LVELRHDSSALAEFTSALAGRPRALVVNGDPSIGDSLRAGLAAGGVRVVSDTRTSASVAALVEARCPDLLILLDAGDRPAVRDTLAVLRTRASRPPAIVVGDSRDARSAREALRAGADAYVLAEAVVEQLPLAVWSVRRGRPYLDPLIGATLVIGPRSRPSCHGLTDRQIGVLRLLALGYTNAEIAGELYLSVRTVEMHRAHIRQRLGLTARAQLVRYALEHELLDDG